MSKTKEFLPKQKELLLLALSAFTEDDGYAHFSYNNLKDIKIGQKTITNLLKELEQEGKIVNYTINGFYNRFLINDIKPCPEFIFNSDLNSTNKLFLLLCLQNLKHFEPRTAKQLAYDLRQSQCFTFESQQLTKIKSKLGISVFDYLKQITYIKKEPTHELYPLIKTESGYQVNTYPDEQRNHAASESERQKIVREHRIQKLLSQSVGDYLLYKVKYRMDQNPERFSYTDLTAEYLNDLYIKQEGKDFYTKTKFEVLKDISVDRIDSSKLYTKNNVVLTTGAINMMKGRLSSEEFITICKQIAQAN